MKKLLLAAALLASTAIGPQGIGSSPAAARLQLTVSDGTQTFSCFDGELSCDSSGGANNLALLNPFSDGTEVQFTLTQSTFGSHNILQLSSSNISASSTRAITFVASDTNFLNPTSFIKSSASLTFNANIPDATDSVLQFWADHANTQGANPANTPGTLLETVSGHADVGPGSVLGIANRSVLRRLAVLNDGRSALEPDCYGGLRLVQSSRRSRAFPSLERGRSWVQASA